MNHQGRLSATRLIQLNVALAGVSDVFHESFINLEDDLQLAVHMTQLALSHQKLVRRF